MKTGHAVNGDGFGVAGAACYVELQLGGFFRALRQYARTTPPENRPTRDESAERRVARHRNRGFVRQNLRRAFGGIGK